MNPTWIYISVGTNHLLIFLVSTKRLDQCFHFLLLFFFFLLFFFLFSRFDRFRRIKDSFVLTRWFSSDALSFPVFLAVKYFLIVDTVGEFLQMGKMIFVKVKIYRLRYTASSPWIVLLKRSWINTIGEIWQ